MAAILALGLVSAIVTGMAVIASTEPAIAANSEGLAAAGYLAEAALEMVAAELQDVPDWSAVVGGAVRSTVLTGVGTTLPLPDGRSFDVIRHTNLMNCGRVAGCTAGQMDEPTADRPWGHNNPRWRIFGQATTGDLWERECEGWRFWVVAWVADDPAEGDGAPDVDAGSDDDPLPAGSGIISVRAESFGPRGAHATRTGTILRCPGTSRVRIANRTSGRR